MSATVGDVCCGCLARDRDMHNMFDTNLHRDYSAVTNLQMMRCDGVSALLCCECRRLLRVCLDFRRRCRQSHDVLRKRLAAIKKENANIYDALTENNNQIASIEKEAEDTVIAVFNNNTFTLQITPKDLDSEQDADLVCPFACTNIFTKRNVLLSHLIKIHGVDRNSTISTEYYCLYENCQYRMDSGKNKHFAMRKTLKNHILNVHKSKGIVCDICKLSFSQDAAFERHKAVCDTRYVCASCNIEYKTNERLMVHLMRKHPHLHREYKKQRKEMKQLARKSIEDKTRVKRIKIDKAAVIEDTLTPKNIDINIHRGAYNMYLSDKLHETDSPKAQFSKSVCTTEINDFYNSPQMLKHTQTDELFATSSNETQTVFEDLLRSEDEFETVSLSAIQNQTWTKKVNTCETQTNPFLAGAESPDLSFKETQTCFCYMDSPKPSTSHFNFPKYLFDSANSSPNGNFTSTETQTAELCSKDVLLSFNSIMTQTSEDTLDESKLIM